MHRLPSGPPVLARAATALLRWGRHLSRTNGRPRGAVLAVTMAAILAAVALTFPMATTASGGTGLPLLSSSSHARAFLSGGKATSSQSEHGSQRDWARSSRSQAQLGQTDQQAATPPAPDATSSSSTASTTTPSTATSSTSSAATPSVTTSAGTSSSGTSSNGMAPAGTSSTGALRPPAGIAADCSADVSAPLTQWVNSLPDHSSILFGQGGCYLVNGSITVTRKVGLTIDGNGSTFKATQAVPSPEINRAQWHLDYGSDITLRNMTLVGIHPATQAYNAAYEYDHNVFIRGTNGVLVDHIVAKSPYGDNVTITQGLDWTTIPGNITISNSIFDGAGRMALSCVACHDVTVDHNSISNTAIFSFDLEIEGNNWPGKNVRFTNNDISGALGGAMFSVGAPVDWSGVDIGNIYIGGNRMTTFANGSFDCDPAISMKDSRSHVDGITIENNELYSISDGVLVKDASNVAVKNNVMHFSNRCGGTAGVHFISVSGGQASGNSTSEFPTPYLADSGR